MVFNYKTESTILKDRKAFTLVELLVVVAVLALLASIVFSNLTGAREQAKISNALSFQSNMHNLLGADLVGWWNFDDEDNRYKDLSGYGNNGSCTSCPTLVDGVPGTSGKAMSFNGSGNYVKLNTVNLDKEFSISGWVYFNGSPSYEYLFARNTAASSDMQYGVIIRTPEEGGNWGVYINGTNKTIKSSKVWPMKEWLHIIVSWDGSLIRGYVNGKLDGSTSFTENLDDLGDFQSIGRRSNSSTGTSSTGLWDGLIDDVRIYSRALTAYEVQTLYAQTKDNYLAEEQ
jgi:prepilin-type N-terminal cleavage/methylation domain-containing protein